MKKNRGITLIALIITVILLLILVGVSVNVIIKGNLFRNAQKAVNGTNAKINEQQTIMDELMNEWDEIEKDYCSHIWKDGEMLLQPTCTTTGKKQMVCENCGNLLEVEIPALGHNFVNRVCTRCGEKEPGCENHTFGDWVITKNSTCVAEGSKKRTCTVCGVEEVETIPATGVHTYGEWQVTKQATCTADGTKTKTCTGCGTKQVETIPATGVHTYGNWVISKQATCIAEGSKKRTCAVCGVEQVETIPATGVHTYGNWVVTKQATCTADGTRTKTCTGCGATQNQVIAKLGHNFVNGTCTRCGEKELVIGANIDYHEYISESGGTVSASYTSTKTTRGSTNSSDSNTTYSVVKNSGIQWIVLGEENGQIKITTKNIVQPTRGGYTKGNFKLLYLSGQKGYANFIDELNKISAVYGKGKYADTTKFSSSGGRSFKLEDLGYGELTRIASYKYARHADGKIYRYEANEIVDGTSTTGGSYTTFNYMTLDASNSTAETTASHTWKSLSTTANSYVTMYQYVYSGSLSLPTSVGNADTYYWLASRSFTFNDDNVYYYAHFKGSIGLYGGNNMYTSNGEIRRNL